MSKELIYEKVYNQIKQRIVEGDWKPGEKIPTVPQLAQDLEVGISSVREAIRILEKQKILKIIQGSGTFISDHELWNSPSDQFDFMTNASLLQLSESRLVIEPELAALAAKNATEEEVTLIKKNANEMAKSYKNNKQIILKDIQFHYYIAKASRNEILFHMMNMIRDLMTDSRRVSSKFPFIAENAVHYHILIANAIAERNPMKARELMSSHIQDLIHEIKKSRPELH
jgi:GntR family transcriptional repressor for pyruvate dehydrogenase complex